VMDTCKGEVDLLMEPGENRFRSLRWDLNDLDPTDVSCGNWGIWAFRGKRYVLALVSFCYMMTNLCVQVRSSAKGGKGAVKESL